MNNTPKWKYHRREAVVEISLESFSFKGPATKATAVLVPLITSEIA